jgi:hypothetical protein
MSNRVALTGLRMLLVFVEFNSRYTWNNLLIRALEEHFIRIIERR